MEQSRDLRQKNITTEINNLILHFGNSLKFSGITLQTSIACLYHKLEVH